MSEEKTLPNIGTPEEALAQMKERYKAFLDITAKFCAISEFYTDTTHIGHSLGEDFTDRYNYYFKKLKESSPEDVYTQLAFFTLLDLDFLSDVKDNLVQYEKLLKGDDLATNDYDKAWDYLTVKDEFTDEIQVFDDTNKEIATEQEADTNYNDPDYDLNAKVVEENKEAKEEN